MSGFKYNFSARKKGKGWQLVLDYKDGSRWRQKTKAGFATKRDAVSPEAKESLLASTRKEINLNDRMKDMTLEKFTRFYLDTRADLSYTSKVSYMNSILRLDRLKGMKLSDIEYSDVAQQAAVISSFSEATVTATMCTLCAVMKAAQKYKAIKDNPTVGYKLPVKSKEGKKRLRTFTDSEIDEYVKRGAESGSGIIACICALTGVRIGEALGLRWSDIDFRKNEITVNKQYKIVGNGDGKNEYGFGPVKNIYGKRTLHVPPKLREKLLEYRSKGILYMDGRLTRIRSTATVQSYMNRVTPNHSPHDFRHTFATKLLSNGVDIKTVSAVLGDTISTVERTYLHYTDDMRRAAATSIDRIFG